MIAFHGKQEVKKAILEQLKAHKKADEFVKGKYWENGKGCAVGCTLHNSNGAHHLYEVGDGGGGMGGGDVGGEGVRFHEPKTLELLKNA